MMIKLMVEGGKMAPGPALSQKIGPLGLNVGEIISKINEATKDFNGLKVPVELDVDPNTKEFDITVSSPPTSELLKKELGIEKASGLQLKSQVANASIEQIISVAKQKMSNLLCKDLKAAVKSVVGTCTSGGILVENKLASVVGFDIDEGKFDMEIGAGSTVTPEEKRQELDSYFAEVKSAQDKVLKAEQAAAAESAEESAEAVAEAVETPPKE